MVRGIKTNKELIESFKKSLIESSELLNKNPYEIKRDEYIRVSVDNNIISRLNKQQLNLLGGFKNARNLFFPPKITGVDEQVNNSDSEKIDIMNLFIQFLKSNNRVPNLKEFEEYSNISSRIVKKHFGDVHNLLTSSVEFDSSCSDFIFNEKFFTEEYLEEVNEKIKKYKKYIITTAVSSKPVHDGFLNSLFNYAENNDALILVLPCEDVANRKSLYKWELDPKLKNCCVIFRDTYLNSNLYINNIKVAAKQINPLTGLARFAQAKGSTILASPKQYLEFVANSNVKLPVALMTTGAVTVPDYSTDFYMSKRISKIAEFDHVIGAVIVEIEDDKIFHFRQIQSSDTGSFIDLGLEYHANGDISKVENTTAIFGDSHVGVHDKKVHEILKDIVSEVNCKDIILHDIFDAKSITHHDIGRPAVRAAKFEEGIISSLKNEGILVRDYLEEIGSWINGKLVIVKSNHDEALDKYLSECRFINDPNNLYLSLDLTRKLIEGKDPLKYMIEEVIGINNDLNIKWLERDEDYMVAGIECGSHGDLGANGAKGSMRGLEKVYHKCVVAHSHSAGIYRQVYQVGTSSYLKLDYNKGPSSWTHTMCLLYPSGQRQLINIITKPNGDLTWRLCC